MTSSNMPRDTSATGAASADAPVRAPGRQGGDTPRRLRAAAARLLTERTWYEISLRDITDLAGANVASVSYHFGSKDALLTLVLRETVLGLVERQATLLDALPPDVSLETFVDVWLSPAFDEHTSQASETGTGWDIAARHLDTKVPEAAAAYAEAHVVVQTSLVSRLGQLLPHLGEDELQLRHVGVLAATAALVGNHPAQAAFDAEMPAAAGPEAVRRAVVAFVCGALNAPATRNDH